MPFDHIVSENLKLGRWIIWKISLKSGCQDISRLWSSLTQKSKSTLGDKFEVLSVEVSEQQLYTQKIVKYQESDTDNDYKLKVGSFMPKLPKTRHITEPDAIFSRKTIVLQQLDFVFIEQLCLFGEYNNQVGFKRDLQQKANSSQPRRRNRVVCFFFHKDKKSSTRFIIPHILI